MSQQIGLNISITGLSGFLIIRWVKASAPLAEVGRNDNPSALTFPYDDVYVITPLQPVVYIVQLWRSDDGTTLDQLIKDWSIDASQSTTASIQTFQYVTDRGYDNTAPVATGDEVWADPANLDTNLVDERLDGFTQDQLLVHEAGFGNKLDSEYNLLAGGGITLLGGKTFDSGVAWFITVASTTTTTATETVTGARYAGVEEVTADMDFFVDSTDNLYNKLCPVNGAGTLITVTFLDLTLIPDDTHVTFNTHQGSQNYTRLQFDSGDTVRFLNQDVNIIDLAKCEEISLYFFDAVCYVTSYTGNASRRGSVMPDYDATRNSDQGNLIYADESLGELDKADYEGLYAFADQLAGDAVCPLGVGVGQWSYDSGGGVYPNKRKYGIDTGAETFRVPHLTGLVAKYSATPGVYEADGVGPIDGDATVPKGHSYTGAPNVARFANGANNPEDKVVAITIDTGNSETTVKSYSQKPFIYL